jgi:hypothetical protein
MGNCRQNPGLLACCAALAGACSSGVIDDRSAAGGSGAMGGDDRSTMVPSSCDLTSIGASPLRRLTRLQYDNTIRDLLGIREVPLAVKALRADFKEGVFDNNAGAVSEVDIEGFMTLAEDIAALATKSHLARITNCPAAEAGADACAARFAVGIGARALRRPLRAEEIATLERLYILGRDGGGFARGIELMLRWLLQSPDFLYHVAFGETDGPPFRRLTPYELAARLSYFLWDTMPDDVLFAAAARGDLDTREGLSAQALRMLADPRSRAGIGLFHVQMVGGDRLALSPKDDALFPRWSPELAGAMRDEAADFADHVFRFDDARLHTLLTAPFTVTKPELAAVYGPLVSDGKPSPPGTRATVQFPAAHGRAGLFSQASFLAFEAHRDQTSPVKRGAFIRENLFCQELPPAPPNVNNAPPPLSADATTRERFEAHRDNPACRSCHVLIDPIGLAFEHFDAVGAYREQENGRPVDARGELVETDVDGPVAGAAELAGRLADSQQVAACMVKQWFRFALGRAAGEGDGCILERLGADFERSDRNLQTLVLSLIDSDAFLFHRAGEP